jgi:antitoxin (DNA-binding transcriptional repressor) of toxin-antitoxin stability system
LKTLGIEQATLDGCVEEAQHDRVIITRNGAPIALLVGIEGLDEQRVNLSSRPEFWQLITERRRQKTISRVELEQRLGGGA